MLKMFILRNSSLGPSYIIKSVDKTKLSCYTHTNATQVSLNPLLFCCLRVPVMVTSVEGIVYHWQNKKFPFMIPTLKMIVLSEIYIFLVFLQIFTRCSQKVQSGAFCYQ